MEEAIEGPSLEIIPGGGTDKYTWASLDSIDKKIVDIFDGKKKGVFVELGANDGFQKSNTLALEYLYDWRGYLIEPIPQLASECKRNRPQAEVVCAAAAAEYGIVKLFDSDLMSSVKPEKALHSKEYNWVMAAPLTSILEALGCPPDFDVLSLDVEGFEAEVLKGLDLDKFRPQYMIVETDDINGVMAIVGMHYDNVEKISYHDYLLKIKG